MGFVFSGKVRRQSPITLLASSASADVICSAIDGCRRRGVTACGLAENVTRSLKSLGAGLNAIKACLVALLILLIPVAAEEITACTEINQSGVYHLANDISENATMCIVINASDVVLDGNGHVIAGNGTGYGIYAEGVENVTVNNLTLTNWSYGVYLEIDRGGVENVNVANSAVDGIYINGSSDVAIRGVVSDSNGETGIVVKGSDSITMEDAVARDNGGSGVLLRSTASSTLRNVTAVSNTYYGIWLDNARNNVLSEINASYNLRGTATGRIIGGEIHITYSCATPRRSGASCPAA